MRRDVVELRRFYAGPLGQAARDMLSRKLVETWGDVAGQDVLGLGYATPVLERFSKARRTVAVMPAEQGVEAWPQLGRGNRTCLARESALPFPNALFDRVLVVHGLEESDDPLALLREVWRVMAPTGRVVLAAAARSGVWCHSEETPFGYGRPFTRTQLEQLAREAELEPIAWSRALYAPPVASLARYAEAFEQAGARLWPRFSGLILLEAVKQTFAVKPKGLGAPARVFSPGALRPARTSLLLETRQAPPRSSESGKSHLDDTRKRLSLNGKVGIGRTPP